MTGENFPFQTMTIKALVAGSAHLAVCAKTKAQARDAAHPGTVSINVGGCAYDVAFSLQSMGCPTRLLTAWNASELSRMMGSHISSTGIELLADEVEDMDIGATVTQTDADGKSSWTVSSTPISGHQFAPERIAKALFGMDCVFLDATLDQGTAKAIAMRAHETGIPVIVLPDSQGSVNKLMDLEGLLTAVVLRPMEVESLLTLLDAADPTEVAQELRTMVFVTRPRRGSVIYQPDGERTRVTLPRSESPDIDANIFAVGVIAGLIRKLPLGDAAAQAFEMLKTLEETKSRHNGLNTMVKGLADAVSRDKLTDLLTRGGLASGLARLGHPAGSLLMVDLDNFKQVNDNHGHDAGDQVLQQVALILSSCIRGADLASRWGGDEFIVFLPNTGLDVAQTVAERMRAAASEAELRGVTLSIGITDVLEKESLGDAIRRADHAMYRAKRTGKNSFAVWTGEAAAAPAAACAHRQRNDQSAANTSEGIASAAHWTGSVISR